MREIKFRAWNKENNKMVQFDFKNIYGYEGEICGIILPDGQTALNFNSGYGDDGFNESLAIMQYTGLKDKHGVEIYEGDVLRKERYWDIYIESDADNARFGFLNTEWVVSQGKIKPIDKYMMNEYEVIGNIYENPELLIK